MLVTQTNLRRTLAFANTNLNNLELLYDDRYSEHNELRIAANTCTVTLSCDASVLTPPRKSSNGVLSPRLFS